MLTLNEQEIKEIAEQLDCGFRCFWHKQSGELLFVPDQNSYPYLQNELFDEDLEKLDNDYGNYVEIERPQSNDYFEIMAGFTEHLDENNRLKNSLILALNKKKPFREFKGVIDNSGVHRQEWFDYKIAQLKKLVRDRLNEAIYNYRKK